MPTKFCLFCEKKGIKPPHDHTIRDFKKKDRPIICPELLKNKCTYCHEIGHTKYYCQKLKEKKIKQDKDLISKLEKDNLANAANAGNAANAANAANAGKTIIINMKKRLRDYENSNDDLDEHINKMMKSDLLSSIVDELTI